MSKTPRSDAVMCCDDFESLCYKLEEELDHAIRGRDQGLDFILAMRADAAADTKRLEHALSFGIWADREDIDESIKQEEQS